MVGRESKMIERERTSVARGKYKVEWKGKARKGWGDGMGWERKRRKKKKGEGKGGNTPKVVGGKERKRSTRLKAANDDSVSSLNSFNLGARSLRTGRGKGTCYGFPPRI